MSNRTTLSGLTVAMTLAFLGGLALADTKPTGPLGLPPVEALQEKLTLSNEQAKQVQMVYTEYKDKAKEVEDKGDAQKMAQMRREIVDKIKEACTPVQKQKLDEIVSEIK